MIEERVFEQLCINRFHDNMQSYLQDPDKRKTVGFIMQEVIAEAGITKIVRVSACDYEVIDYKDVNISRLLAEMLLIDEVTLKNFDKFVTEC